MDNRTALSDLESHFDKTVTLIQNGKEIEYGIIDGNNTIVHNLEDYKVYYLGHSNGAALGIINAWHFPEIKRLVCINAPLMMNPHQLVQGIKEFDGEKMSLVYGSKDPSFDMLKLYSELESEKIDFIRVKNADHNFTGTLDFFIELPGLLLFGDELKCKNVKVHQ